MTKPTILFAWEMGANFGHVSKIGEIAAQLIDQFNVVIAARNPVAFRQIYPDLPVTLLPAPYQPTRAMHQGESVGQSYPGVLLTEGWDSATTLAALAEAWRALFALVQPDILVSQAAPTALLAARGLAMKTAILGSGYDTPPRTTPMQTFSRGNAEAEAKAHVQEANTLAVANDALAQIDAPALTEFSDLLETDLTLLVSYPELDHHSWRADVQPDHPPYLGQIFSTQSGADVAWRNRGAPCVLAYLRPDAPHFAAVVQALAQIGPNHDIILAAPGIAPKLRDQLLDRSVLVVNGPVKLAPLMDGCNLGLSNGTNGIVAAFINAGVPQLCVPGHREQMMCAAALAQAGLGLGIAGSFGAPEVADAIRKALGSEKIRANAQQAKARIVTDGLDRPAEQAAELLRGLI